MTKEQLTRLLTRDDKESHQVIETWVKSAWAGEAGDLFIQVINEAFLIISPFDMIFKANKAPELRAALWLASLKDVRALPTLMAYCASGFPTGLEKAEEVYKALFSLLQQVDGKPIEERYLPTLHAIAKTLWKTNGRGDLSDQETDFLLTVLRCFFATAPAELKRFKSDFRLKDDTLPNRRLILETLATLQT